MGPTVCELDGPMPIVNNSNVLIDISFTRRFLFGCLDYYIRHPVVLIGGFSRLVARMIVCEVDT